MKNVRNVFSRPLGLLVASGALICLLASPACFLLEDDVDDGQSQDAGGGEYPDGGGGEAGWRQLNLLDNPNGDLHQGVDRVTGIWCGSVDECVVVTESWDSGGVMYSANRSEVTEILMTGREIEEPAGVLGTVDFLGLQHTSQGLIARVDVAPLLVSAPTDYTNPESWTLVDFGINGTSSNFNVLNAQELIQASSDGRWLYMYTGVLWGAESDPGTTTMWAGLWSPGRVPPFPSNYNELKADDPLLCDSGIGPSISPDPTQFAYASPDLSLVMYPANGINQGGTDLSGVCVSTDGGNSFYQVPFPSADIGDELGPLAIYCSDEDHCFAYNGLAYDDNSAYVYYSTNASDGRNMTWTRATLPTLPVNQVLFRHMFFAPGSTNGWLVGSNNNNALLLRTTDGGQTWEDISGPVMALVGKTKLHSGFALDANNIWIGGEKGVLLFNGKGGDE